MSTLTVTLDETTQKQLEHLVRRTGKPKEAVLREVVETGLKSYPNTPTKSAQAVLDLIAWAEKNQIKSTVHDLSTNHNKYAWEEYPAI